MIGRTFFLALALLACWAAAAGAQTRHPGVNLAGAEFGDHALPGTYGIDYIYPTRSEVDYFLAKGLGTIRLPFRWERLQPKLSAAFSSAEQRRLDDFVRYATGRGAHVILDPHNYARYKGAVIGSAQLPLKHFRDFWKRLATRYKGNSRVILGLMNEPHSMPTEQWLRAANAAIAAIRNAGARNLILVPGNAWTGAHSWQDNWYGTPNGTVMPRVQDPLNRFAFEVHQYLDSDFSGTSPSCAGAAAALSGVTRMTAWLRSRGYKGFLGEIGVAASADCLQALDGILDHLDGNTDVWLGWTYWAAGPWWGDYMFSVEPVNGQDRPQMEVLRAHAAD